MRKLSRQKGANFQIRLAREVKNTFNFKINTTRDVIVERAKVKLTKFLMKCRMVMEFKSCNQYFLNKIYGINARMNHTASSYRLKLQYLDEFFEREFHSMKVFSF